MEYIEYMQRKEKKRLDFNRPTFDEPEFKIPCREITNKVEDNVLKRPSNKSSLADDEESLQDSVASKESISVQSKFNVHLRLKPIKDPLPDVYNFDIKSNLVTVTSSMMTIERQYTFTSILDDNKDQKTLYDECVRPILADPFSSQGAVFASYGVSNSGKTYTILGQENPGIVPRALAQIFSENHNQIEKYPACKLVNNQIAFLDDNKANSELMLSMDLLADAKKIRGKLANQWVAIDENHHFTQREVAEEFQQIYVWVSFLEIYNEKIIDLLKPPKSGQSKFERPLKIISNNHDPYILGLTWICVSNIHDALHLLQFGLQRANYAQTGLNPHSSRSHTIFTIQLISEIATGNMSKFEIASYKFCDLAGAERISKTSNTGDRIKEAGGINSSLLVLGRCLEAVQYNQNVGIKRKQIVPVRDSKLTMLLESSLKGFEKFVMIVNLQPNIECLDENLNVLHFGSIANKIVTRSKMPRKFTRRSSRYSHVAGSTVNNSVQLTESCIYEESDESSLDLSFQIENMPSDMLRNELRLKILELDTLKDIVEKKEREFLEQQQKLREYGNAMIKKHHENDEIYFKEQMKIKEDYYQKKMEAMDLKYNRKYNQFLEEIDCLERENQKLKKKLGMNDDIAVINIDDDDDEDEEEEYEEDSRIENSSISE